MPYDYHCQLLKSAFQNHDQSHRANAPRDVRKVHKHDLNLISDITKMSNSSEETYDVDSSTPILMENMVNRSGNNDKLNGHGNNHAFFDKCHMIPK